MSGETINTKTCIGEMVHTSGLALTRSTQEVQGSIPAYVHFANHFIFDFFLLANSFNTKKKQTLMKTTFSKLKNKLCGSLFSPQ